MKNFLAVCLSVIAFISICYAGTTNLDSLTLSDTLIAPIISGTSITATTFNVSGTLEGSVSFKPYLSSTIEAITNAPIGSVRYDSVKKKLRVYSGVSWETVTSN